MSRMDTWMPLFVADYLADTMGLSAEEHGAYLLLLMDYWRHGPLLDDDKRLSAIARVERRRWNSTIGCVIRSYFTVGSDGRLHQKRLDKERNHALDLSAKRRIAASKKVGASQPCIPIESMAEAEQLQSDCAEHETLGQTQCSVTGGVQESELSAAQNPDSPNAQKSMLFPLPKPNDINGNQEAIAKHMDTFCTPFARSLHESLSRDLLQKEESKEESKKESPHSPPLEGGQRARRRMPQSPIPNDWTPDAEGMAYAQAKRAPRDTAAIRAFINYHQAHGSVRANWPASWRQWCDHAEQFGRTTPTAAPVDPTKPRKSSMWVGRG